MIGRMGFASERRQNQARIPSSQIGRRSSVCAEQRIDVVLEPGEFSIHHEAVVHGSNPNNADHPRIGISIHYIAPHVHQVLLTNATATLVRGSDPHGHWQEDPEPSEDFDPICLKALDATYGEYLTGAGKY